MTVQKGHPLFVSKSSIQTWMFLTVFSVTWLKEVRMRRLIVRGKTLDHTTSSIVDQLTTTFKFDSNAIKHVDKITNSHRHLWGTSQTNENGLTASIWWLEDACYECVLILQVFIVKEERFQQTLRATIMAIGFNDLILSKCCHENSTMMFHSISMIDRNCERFSQKIHSLAIG